LARRLGRRGDGGVDGMLALDELGLDVIYVQAKRLRPGNAVPVSDVRDFVGSLEAHHATKGVFIATSHFTGSARSVVRQISRRVALVDGVGMADLMIRHNIGVRTAESYQLKKLDTDYFAAGARRISEISSASIQPRR
jgi:restriction system protein